LDHGEILPKAVEAGSLPFALTFPPLSRRLPGKKGPNQTGRADGKNNGTFRRF
jgi:hypothetical protein